MFHTDQNNISGLDFKFVCASVSLNSGLHAYLCKGICRCGAYNVNKSMEARECWDIHPVDLSVWL